MKNIKSKLPYGELVAIAVSVIFGLMFTQIVYAGDDAVRAAQVTGSPLDWLWLSVDCYESSSSRIIINALWFLILKLGKASFCLFMAISMYAFVRVLFRHFSTEESAFMGLYVICAVMLFPFDTLSTAGWIATSTSYFGPPVFALVAMIPIKKVYNGEKLGIWEMVFYSVCLMFGANSEQMNVILLMVYAVAVIYFLVCKRSNGRIFWFLFLTLVSVANMALCPGNWLRKEQEEKNWFSTYGMLDAVDKADIGLSTTLKWIFADGIPLMIFICVTLCVLVWKKYRDSLYRLVALMPVGITVFLGPLKSVLGAVFPYAEKLGDDVGYYGAFTVNDGEAGVVQFVLFMAAAACIILEIILLNDNTGAVLADITLLCAGVASRAMMGFSPTVYASSTRTYTPMAVCFAAVAVHIMSNNSRLFTNGGNDGKISEKYIYILCGIIIIAFVNLEYMILTIMR